MRMMMTVSMPVEAGNAAAIDGTLGSTIKKILEATKAEAAYFTANNGERTGFIFFDLKKASDIPGLVEPAFLALNARVNLQPVMTAEDLAAAMPGIDKAVKAFARK